LYLNPDVYRERTPPGQQVVDNPDDEGKCPGWTDSLKYLERCAHICGNPVVGNGGHGTKYKDRHLVCAHCYRVERESVAMEVTEENPYRATSMTNDRRNNRLEGQKGPKRVKTADQSNVCHFKFTEKYDDQGRIYINFERRVGQHMHNNHPKPFDNSSIPWPSRLLTQEERTGAQNSMDAQSSKAAGRNFVKTAYNKFINSSKALYLNKRNKKGPAKSADMNDIDRMVANLEKRGDVKFTTLSDTPESMLEGGGQGTVTMSTVKEEDGTVVNTDIKDLPEISNLEENVKLERQQRNLSAAEVLFISIAWTVIPAFRFFLLCPEVIWCDITSHSNNQGFHLLTFSCKTSTGKQVVFLWIWIPNQRRFSFRWVFQHALRVLIPLHHRERVRLIMKDGDAQQRNEVLYALDGIFPNAIEGGCGYHIVTRGWLKNCNFTNMLRKKSQARWSAVAGKIQAWVYSWMKPSYVENMLEYLISKCILLTFVCSAPVLAAADGHAIVIENVLKFLRGHVFVHEKLYLHFLRRKVLTMEAAHGSGHEVS
jgi:hypothetical protein